MNWVQRAVTRLRSRINLATFHSLNGIDLRVNRLSNVMRYHIYAGTYEEEDRDMCQKHLTKSDQVLELGSSIGYLSLYCMKKLGIEKVACVEPNPIAIEELLVNYDRNDLRPCFQSVCLAEKEQEVPFYKNANLWACNTIRKDLLVFPDSITVKGKNLEAIMAGVPFTPDTLLIDIEGAEQFFQEADFAPCIKKIIIELHPKITGMKVAFQVLNKMMNADFEVVDKKRDVFVLKRNC